MRRPFRMPGEPVPVVPPRYPSKPTPNKPPRRGFLVAMGALAGTSGSALAAPLPDPDAELIRLCAAYIAVRHAYNDYDGPWTEDNEHPHEAAMAEVEDRLEGMHATTIAGVAALARVALDEGEMPNGSFCYCTAGPWLEQAVRDLLRLQ